MFTFEDSRRVNQNIAYSTQVQNLNVLDFFFFLFLAKIFILFYGGVKRQKTLWRQCLYYFRLKFSFAPELIFYFVNKSFVVSLLILMVVVMNE